MNKRLLILADRRRDLIEKIEVQRREMAEMAVYWESPLAVVDRGIKAVHLVQSNPLLMGGGITAFLALRRTGIFGLAQKGVRLLYLYPFIFSVGLKCFSWLTHSSSEARSTKVNH